MRIVYIAAGAGGMYCGACARDISLVKGLMARGHDVEIVPLYTPLRPDTDDAPETAPVFYGGINVFLQQASTVFRGLPRFMDRWLDSPALLRLVSGFAINTSPKDLGPMTVSVLAGKDGLQGKELDRLIDYLESAAKPDIVSITNSMLSAIAPEIKRRMSVPVVCALQGEDGFVQSMPEKYAKQARDLMAKNAGSIDRFVAPGEDYAQQMAEYLRVPPEKVAVVPAGVDIGLYKRNTPRIHSPFTIGYLSVIAEPKGLDILIEAFAKGFKLAGEAKLVIAGKIMKKPYWEKIQARIRELGITDNVQYIGEIDLKTKLEMLESCSVFIMPSRINESRGMIVMEAMSKSLPVIAPDNGIFPELIGRHDAGVLVKPEDPKAIAEALNTIMSDPTRAEQLASNARQTIEQYYSINAMTDKALEVYEDVL